MYQCKCRWWRPTGFEMVLKECSVGLGASTYLLNTVGLFKLLRLRVELSLSSLISRALHQSWCGGGCEGREFSNFKQSVAADAHLWMSPHACDGCLLCGHILSPIPQEIYLLPPEKTSVFVYMSVPEIFFFLMKYMCSKSALDFFSLDSGRNWSLQV